MSCLISREKQDSLRDAIAGTIYKRAKEGIPLDLAAYVKEIYDFALLKSKKELYALDAARLVPLFVFQILALKPEILKEIKKNTPRIEYDVLELKDLFEVDLTNVRDFLGLKRNANFMPNVIQNINAESKRADEVKKSDYSQVEYTDFPVGPFMTFGTKTLGANGENSLEYKVQRALDKSFKEQIKNNGIDNSSQMSYPGLIGGIYAKVQMEHKYNTMYFKLVDQNGSPIKFNNDGEISATGTSPSYKVATLPLTNSKGQVITDEAEFENALLKEKSKPVPNLYVSAPQVFKNIQKQIKNIIKQNNPDHELLTPEEKNKAFIIASKEVNDEYQAYLAMNKYLDKNPDSSVITVLNGSNPGFVEENVWKRTPLSSVNFQNSKISITLETKLQPAGSNFKVGNIYFKYPGVDKPLVAVGASFVEKPEILNKIIALYTEPLFQNDKALEPDERLKYISQFMSPLNQGINFGFNYVKDAEGVITTEKNWFNSDKSLTIQVGTDRYKIKYDNSPESKKLQQNAAEAIRKKLTSGYIVQEGTEENPIQNNEDREYLGGKGWEESVKMGAVVIDDITKATPNSILLKKNADGKDLYFKVHFPGLNAENGLVNGPYQQIAITRSGEKPELKTRDGQYNDYITDNFFYI